MIRKAQSGLDIRYINSPSQNKDSGNQEYKDSGLDYSKGVSDARNFLSNWITKRKETGGYDDQLQDIDFMQNRITNTPILISSNYTNSGGRFDSPNKDSLGGIKLNSNVASDSFNAPSYGKNLFSNTTHELTHAMSLYSTNSGKRYANYEQANEAAASSVTAPLLKINSILGGNLVPMSGSYENTAAEIYARLMQMRQEAKMDPTKKFKYNDYKYLLGKYGIDFGKEKSEALMNEVADNSTNSSFQLDNGVYMGKMGIKIFGL